CPRVTQTAGTHLLRRWSGRRPASSGRGHAPLRRRVPCARGGDGANGTGGRRGKRFAPHTSLRWGPRGGAVYRHRPTTGAPPAGGTCPGGGTGGGDVAGVARSAIGRSAAAA